MMEWGEAHWTLLVAITAVTALIAIALMLVKPVLGYTELQESFIRRVYQVIGMYDLKVFKRYDLNFTTLIADIENRKFCYIDQERYHIIDFDDIVGAKLRRDGVTISAIMTNGTMTHSPFERQKEIFEVKQIQLDIVLNKPSEEEFSYLFLDYSIKVSPGDKNFAVAQREAYKWLVDIGDIIRENYANKKVKKVNLGWVSEEPSSLARSGGS